MYSFKAYVALDNYLKLKPTACFTLPYIVKLK